MKQRIGNKTSNEIRCEVHFVGRSRKAYLNARCVRLLPLFYWILAMLDPKVFEEISGRLSALIAASPAADIEKNVRALLTGFFSRLDLVSREEFDVQAQVLQRTREKLDALEKRVAQLEILATPPTDAG